MNNYMDKIPQTDISWFSYDLPEHRIARYPLEARDSSKLLVYNKGDISDSSFHELPSYIPPDSLMVFNNTRVIHARLNFRKKTGARIEIFCLEPYKPASYEEIFETRGSCSWKCLVGNKKKWKSGSLETYVKLEGEKVSLQASLLDTEKNIVEFKWDNPVLTFSDIIESAGDIPIPPYLNRESEKGDEEWYQTVYAENSGSVAAPTAGLHFTSDILKKLKSKGIKSTELTLHVGAGTFRPVQTKLKDHEMHSEHFIVSKKQLIDIKNKLGNIVAIGTTSVRTLESLYWLGIKIIDNKPEAGIFNIAQWEAYNNDNHTDSSAVLQALLTYMDENKLEKIEGDTRIIIVPGYKFRIVNSMLTNYHMPKSTLILLVAAFIGDDWRRLYKHALDNDYRFLSYGDSSLLMPQTNIITPEAPDIV